MSAQKLYLHWATVLVCLGPLSAAPVSTASPAAPSVAELDYYDPVRWGVRSAGARAWQDRTAAVYRDRVRQAPVVRDRVRPAPVVRESVSVSQRGHSGVRENSRMGGEAGIKTQPRAKAFVSGVRVAEDKWREGYETVKSQQQNTGQDRTRYETVEAQQQNTGQDRTRYETVKAQQQNTGQDRTRYETVEAQQNTGRDRTRGPSRRPQRPTKTRHSPKLSYIQRRRPFGAVATIGTVGLKGTRGTVPTAAPPSRPVTAYIPRPKATSRPAPVAAPKTRPTIRPTIRPAMYPPSRAGGNPFRRKPSLTRRKPTQRPVVENPKDPKDRLTVINAAGLVPGTVIKKKLSVGLNVPHNGNRPMSGVRTTNRPKHTTESTHSGNRFTTSIFRDRIPHSTRSPIQTTGKTSTSAVNTTAPTPSVEVLNLYEVGVLPNASDFLSDQKPLLKHNSHGQTGDRTRGVSGTKGSTKVTFPLYVLPAPDPTDRPPARPGLSRPCCKGRPGLVVPVAAPDRPVYPSVGSGPQTPRPAPSVPTSRPGLSRPSTSYGPPERPPGLTPPSGLTPGLTPPSALTPPSGLTPGVTPSSGLTPPSWPTGRPCGTTHCLLPPTSYLPPPLTPEAPTTSSTTSLGSVGNDLVCVYLRSNGSALVLRADLESGRYNISDDQDHLLSSPGWLGINRPQLRDTPSYQHQYDIVYIDNQTTTVQQLLTRMRNRTERWKEAHRPQTSIVCIVQRPENDTSGGTPFKPTESPKPSEEPVTPSVNPIPTSTPQPTTTTTPRPTILGAMDTLSSTIATAVDTLGATAEAQLVETMSAADQTAVVIGSSMKNVIGTSIPAFALATTVGIPVFVAMLALLGAPPLLLSALSVSSPLLLQGVAVIYNSLPN